MTQNILQLNESQARNFFLKESSYTTLILPPYLKFEPLIKKISEELEKSTPICKKNDKGNIYPSNYEYVNYKLFTNKDGKYAWRLFQLIHPVLYVDLVHKMTEENHWKDILLAFEGFQQNKKIVCANMPIVSLEKNSTKEQILVWSKQVEQKSIELGLKYDYILKTDIVDCYGAIYTHSVPWAIHTKAFAKKNRGNEYIGNAIDTALRGMNYGQTNGIPQGSILMNFIAEIVLGYIDEYLSQCLNKGMDYHIIRYRDDYRIFTNNKKDGDTIIRELSKILSELGMRLNGEKTFSSDDIINSSIKEDKLHQIIHNYQPQKDLKKQLLVIKNLADNYPNSGSLLVALNEFKKHLEGISTINNKETLCVRRGARKTIRKYFKLKRQSLELVSILTSIALKNPRIELQPIFASILSNIICNLSRKRKENTINLVVQRFENKPNSEHMHLWLQRIALVANLNIEDVEENELVKFINFETKQGIKLYSIPIGYKYTGIWNSKKWLADSYYDLIKKYNIVSQEEIDKLDCVISLSEVNSFYSPS